MRRLPYKCKPYAPRIPARPSVSLPVELYERVVRFADERGLTRQEVLEYAVQRNDSRNQGEIT